MSEAERIVEEARKIFCEIGSLRTTLMDMIRNHEENLSDIAGKMEENLQNGKLTSEKDRGLILVDCRKWAEFRELSVRASLVAYEMDMWNVFSLSSACHEFIFRYSEKIPFSKNDVTHGDSVCHKVLNLDPLGLRRWLSRELKVPEEKIIEGNLVALSQYPHQYGENARRENTILEYYRSI